MVLVVIEHVWVQQQAHEGISTMTTKDIIDTLLSANPCTEPDNTQDPTHPPLNAPTGLRRGSAAVGVSINLVVVRKALEEHGMTEVGPRIYERRESVRHANDERTDDIFGSEREPTRGRRVVRTS